MEWLWIALGIAAGLAVLPFLALLGLHLHILYNYMETILRIFQERPLFIIPRGKPIADAEEFTLPTPDGLTLHGVYLHTRGPRRGVILFGLEFGSNRWACVPYCEFLREAGYDIAACETRGQGESPAQAGYEPLQWITDFEVDDFRTILAYLKNRPDRHARGVGFFGLSKGGGTGVMAAAHDPFVRCLVTDGIFATQGTMVPYMQHWIKIYIRLKWVPRVLPLWYYRFLAHTGVRRSARERKCHYPSLRKRMPLLSPRPIFMIHGAGDTYIKPDMAQELFKQAGAPKSLWLVPGAKHNQCFHVAQAEYMQRVRAFFDEHLGDGSTPSAAPFIPAPAPPVGGAPTPHVSGP